MLIKASQYFEITSFSINFTSVFINTCDDSQMNLHKDNFLMSFYKNLILLYKGDVFGRSCRYWIGVNLHFWIIKSIFLSLSLENSGIAGKIFID